MATNLTKQQEYELLGWRVVRHVAKLYDTSRPFISYDIIQPDGQLYELFTESGEPFHEIMTEQDAWEILFESDDTGNS